MKVLYLIDTLAIGGAEHSLLAILQRFKQVKPIVCHIYQGNTLKPEFEALGIPVISLDIPEKYAFRQAINQVWSLLKSHKPDILHTTLFRADIIGRIAGRLAGYPVISSFVSEPYHADRWASFSPLGRLKLKICQELDWLTARWVCHFIAVSEPTKIANCQAVGALPEKVSVIHRGRDPKPFLSVSEEQVNELRVTLALPKDVPILLNVARILQLKGQEELIRAIPLVLQEFPEIYLLIAGEGPDRPRLEKLIEELKLVGTVRLLGMRQDIPQLLQIADVFVFPSHFEGFPGSLIEAMFAGCPTVVSDIPVHQETIAPGKTGLLAPVKDPEALAQQIIWLLNHPDQGREMGRQAQQVALKCFHIEQVAAQHERMYLDVLNGCEIKK